MIVTILSRKGKAFLVENKQDGIVRRWTIQAEEYPEAAPGQTLRLTEDYLLEQAIPYGYPWEEVFKQLDFSPEHFANEFRKEGIWTVEDFLRRRADIVSIIRAKLGLETSNLTTLVKHMEEHND